MKSVNSHSLLMLNMLYASVCLYCKIWEGFWVLVAGLLNTFMGLIEQAKIVTAELIGSLSGCTKMAEMRRPGKEVKN